MLHRTQAADVVLDADVVWRVKEGSLRPRALRQFRIGGSVECTAAGNAIFPPATTGTAV